MPNNDDQKYLRAMAAHLQGLPFPGSQPMNLQAPPIGYGPAKQARDAGPAPAFPSHLTPWHGGSQPHPDFAGQHPSQSPVPSEFSRPVFKSDPQSELRVAAGSLWNSGVQPKMALPQRGVLPEIGVEWSPLAKSEVGLNARWNFKY